MNDKIISKIEKLLNLGNGTSFKGEADMALQLAYQIMQANNLTMEDIKGHSREAELGPLGTTSSANKQLRKWEKSILCSLARLFDCQIISTRSGSYYDRKAEYTIVGRESNRVTVKLMYDWIQKDTLKKARKIGGAYASVRNSYATGVANAINRKVSSLKATAPKSDVWGIVPVDEVQNYVDQIYGKLKNTSIKHINIRDAAAYCLGRSDGDKISLNRQVSSIGIEYKG